MTDYKRLSYAIKMSRFILSRCVPMFTAGYLLSITMLWITATPNVALAHEAWIQPVEFRIQKGDPIRAHIRVGKSFRGNSQVFNDDKFVLLQIANKASQSNIKGRLGDIPAIRYKVKQSGLHSLGYQSTGTRVTYETWEKFEQFAKKQGVEWILEEHRKRGYAESGFEETFYRYAKSLFSVDRPDGKDVIFGLPFEIVALTNPYIGKPDHIEVQLLLAGKPHPDEQISVFHRTKDGKAVRNIVHTDQLGKASIPTEAGHQFLLSAVTMEAQEKKKNAARWYSHWASLTYEIFPVNLAE
jgi:uncharacterized GH25 family protein